jgi:hypothetical protein
VRAARCEAVDFVQPSSLQGDGRLWLALAGPNQRTRKRAVDMLPLLMHQPLHKQTSSETTLWWSFALVHACQQSQFTRTFAGWCRDYWCIQERECLPVYSQCPWHSTSIRFSRMIPSAALDARSYTTFSTIGGRLVLGNDLDNGSLCNNTRSSPTKHVQPLSIVMDSLVVWSSTCKSLMLATTL